MFPELSYCMCVLVNLLSGSENLKPCWMAYIFLYACFFFFFLNIQFSSHFFWLKETSNPKLVPCVSVNVHVLDL